MNRYVMCVVGALLGAACDDRTKSAEQKSARNAERSMALPSSEARAAVEQAEPDNRQKNVRDRDDTVSPMDQGNSTAETAITANIRRGVIRSSDEKVFRNVYC